MRAFEFTDIVENSEIESVQTHLKNMGFIEFKRKGNTIYGIVEIPPKQKNKDFYICTKDRTSNLSKDNLFVWSNISKNQFLLKD